MTVQENISPKKVVSGPLAVGALIPLDFEYTNEEDIKVDVNGAAYTYNVDYEVTLQNVEIKTAIEGTVPVTVYRDTPLDQQAEFPQNNKFNSAKLNEALDKICMQQQEQQETIDRSMRVPISVEVENFNPEIPTPMAGRTFRIKDDLSGFEYSQYDPDQAYDDTLAFKDQAGRYATAARNSATNAASSANTASQKANEAAGSANKASQQASIATAKTEEVYITYQKALNAIAGATTRGTTSISTATNEAIRSVNSTGTSNVSNITNVGQDQLRQIQEETAKARDYAQKAIGWNITYEPSGTEDTLVFIDRTPEEIAESISYVEEARDQAITAIQTTASDIQGSINTATTAGVNSVNAAKTEALTVIAAETSKEVTIVRNETATCITSIQVAGTDVLGSITTAETQATTTINDTKTAALNTINATISAAETSIETSRQICEEMAQRATLGWLVEFEDDCLTFTSVQQESED